MKFNNPFRYAPQPSVKKAAESLIARIHNDPELDALFSEGKMMGVLIVEGGEALYAFSGLAGGRINHDGFVPPIFDYTDPEGYFRQEGRRIDSITQRIEKEEDSERKKELVQLRKDKSVALQKWLFEQYHILNARGESKNIVEIFSEHGLVAPGGTGDCALPKLLQYAYSHGLKPVASGEFWYGAPPVRELRREGSFYPSCTSKCGPLLGYMLQGLDVEDPFSEILQDEKSYTVLYEDDSIIVVDKPSGMLSVPGRVKADSLLDLLQKRLTSNRAGEVSYDENCATLGIITSRVSERKESSFSLPSVREEKRKALNGATACGGVGGADVFTSDTSPVKVYACHRLDMDTAGIMVFAKSLDAQSDIQEQFANGWVTKSYVALLGPGSVELKAGDEGVIDLPLFSDYENRPRQMVDYENGKPSLTEYKVLCVLPDSVVVRFTPRTGRTHQLRVHAAHPAGLGRPIVGDLLYGGGNGQKLHLKAVSIRFRHPVTNQVMFFSVEESF